MKDFKQGAQTHPGLDTEGARMGFAKGGAVRKQTSPQFRMTAKEMKAGQTGEKRTESSNENDKKLGGKSTLMPGYKKGGYVKKYGKGGRSCYMKGGKAYMMKGGKMCPMSDAEYKRGGYIARGKESEGTKLSDEGRMKKAMGGAVAKGATKAIKGAIHKRHTAKGRGEGVKAKGRGAKAVGKGGKTGMHKGFKHSKSKG